MTTLYLILSATLLSSFLWNIITIARMDSKTAKETGYLMPSSQYYYTVYNYLLRFAILYVEVEYIYFLADFNYFIAIVFLVMFVNTLLATLIEVLTRVTLLQLKFKRQQKQN